MPLESNALRGQTMVHKGTIVIVLLNWGMNALVSPVMSEKQYVVCVEELRDYKYA